jgi:hypothetical protein
MITNISEDCIAPIFRVQPFEELVTAYKSTEHYNSEDYSQHFHCLGNVKSQRVVYILSTLKKVWWIDSMLKNFTENV